MHPRAPGPPRACRSAIQQSIRASSSPRARRGLVARACPTKPQRSWAPACPEPAEGPATSLRSAVGLGTRVSVVGRGPLAPPHLHRHAPAPPRVPRMGPAATATAAPSPPPAKSHRRLPRWVLPPASAGGISHHLPTLEPASAGFSTMGFSHCSPHCCDEGADSAEVLMPEGRGREAR